MELLRRKKKKKIHSPVVDAWTIRSKALEEVGSWSRARILSVLIGIEIGTGGSNASPWTGTAHTKRGTRDLALSTAAQLFLNLARPRIQTRTPNDRETPWAPPKGLRS
jgi:hypothetical protein